MPWVGVDLKEAAGELLSDRLRTVLVKTEVFLPFTVANLGSSPLPPTGQLNSNFVLDSVVSLMMPIGV